LTGKRFVDAGSGSGLFSLAARRLGARVVSFDIDPGAIRCTEELKSRFFSDDPEWTILEGSVLDDAFLDRLGQFQIVYSWGVLHHTGRLWQALENAHRLVEPGGQLFIAIYNDQGLRSRLWRAVKRLYNRLPRFARLPYVVIVMLPFELRNMLVALASLQPGRYVRGWTRYKSNRGMSRWHDLIDWVGGCPFEVAKPEEIFRFYRHRGYTLTELTTQGVGSGCNEFVLRKSAELMTA
jgi:2-polyprenyl-6-hydroxyphenyl methylase/3-demethylubiquinone-9 3-methyltransferase